ncbi:MAG: hypothetical protein KAS64_08075, partial [Spirochaetes bacterium]|nr:hypothetical protein [Spirochaetota bacterium]
NVISFGNLFSTLGIGESAPPKIEDPFLLQREELKKQWKVLALKEKEFSGKSDSLKKDEQKLNDFKDRLKGRDLQLKERKKKIDQESIAKTSRHQRIQKVAIQFIQMPPLKAVERLEQLKDDLLIIEILKAIDTVFKNQGKKSTVPYLLSLMDKKRAAVIQRKMANIPSIKENSF